MSGNGGGLDRRLFVGAGALTLASLSSRAFAQQSPTGAAMADAKTISQVVADYIAGFDLKSAPPVAIDRARIAFIDTIGVMLAGSHEEVSHLAVEMVRDEASAPQATIVGQSLRASPQLAALANGVASHAMDYDLTYISGQAAAAIVPAILPLAETTRCDAGRGDRGLYRGCRGRRAPCARELYALRASAAGIRLEPWERLRLRPQPRAC